MSDRLRGIVGDPPERRVIGKKATRAEADADECCENCFEPINPGDWQLPVTIGSYTGHVHEVCPS